MDIEENTPEVQEEGQVEEEAQLTKKWDLKPGGIIMVIISGIALAFIIWLIYSIWSLSSEGPTQVVPPEPVKELTNEEMTPDNYRDVPGRNPELLGLGIHHERGRYYTHPESGKTLYVNTSAECSESCQEHFETYEAAGVPYYIYKYDNHPGDMFAENFDGVFEIARP